MNNKTLKLICEYDFDDIEVITEQSSLNESKRVKMKGPYLVAEKRNNNKRKYLQKVMESAVTEFSKKFIVTDRAVGELNHPDTVDINYENACHKILSLKQEGNIWVGESQVLLGTPKGDLLAGLLNNGVKVGVSSRGVGNITEDNVVDEYKLCTVDVVHDPSAPGAFVDGILESKNFMIDGHGDIVEVAYNVLEKQVSTLPVDQDEKREYLVQAVRAFIGSI